MASSFWLKHKSRGGKLDPETIAVYNREADAYAKLVSKDKPGEALQRFVKRLGKGAIALDLGCGPANAAAFMRDNGLVVDAIDASSEMVRLANQTHNIGARVAQFEDIDAVGEYDGIWANFSLLHA
ncbi:MAG: class I SAM-dependent methyltransferase, partial [Pseudomonadota bacterium]